MSILFVLLIGSAFAELTPVHLTSKVEGNLLRWWDENSVVERYKNMDGINKTLFMTERVFRKGDYASCLGLISNLLKNHPNEATFIKPWILNKQLKCALKIIKKDKRSLLKQGNPDISWFTQVLDSIRARHLNAGTYSKPLKLSWTDAHIELLDLYTKTKHKLAYNVLDKLFDNKNYWENSPKFQSQIYSMVSDLTSQDLNSSVAYLHRSLSIKDNDEVLSKLESLQNKNFLGEQDRLIYPKKPEQLVDTSNTFLSKEEQKLVDKLSNGKSNVLDFLKNYFLLLESYPGSIHLTWASKNAVDIYVRLFKRSKLNLTKKQANLLVTDNINLVSKDFILDLSSKLYWSQVYDEAYNLLKTSFEKNIPGFFYDDFLFQTARAAYTVNDTNFAKSVYIKLINQYSGSEFVSESLFRLGLIHIKLKDFSGAAGIFEKLLLKDDEDLKLGTMYWLWVSLIKQKGKEKASEISKQILEEYPLTYYSMKVRAHYNDGKLANFISNKPDATLKLLYTSAETQAFERLQYLLNVGWFDEAGLEIESLSDFENPTIMALKAKYWYIAGDFLKATKLIQRAWELDKSLVNSSFIKFTYPYEFVGIIKSNIEKFKYPFSYEIPLSIIRQESLFKVDAISPAGAFGLMQLTPGTLKETASLAKVDLNRDDFGQNIMLGMGYINRMLKAFDNHLPQALAAYNAGIGRYRAWLLAYKIKLKSSVEYIDELWIEDLPYAETRFYVKAILRTILMYRVLDNQVVDMKKPFW